VPGEFLSLWRDRLISISKGSSELRSNDTGMKMNFIVVSHPPPTDSAFLILDCPIGSLPGTSPAIGLMKIGTLDEVAGFCEGVGHVRFASHGADADYEGIDPILCPVQMASIDKQFFSTKISAKVCKVDKDHMVGWLT